MAKNKNLSGGLFSKKLLTVKESTVSAGIEQYLNLRQIYNLRLNSGAIFEENSYLIRSDSDTTEYAREKVETVKLTEKA